MQIQVRVSASMFETQDRPTDSKPEAGLWAVHVPFAPRKCPFFYGWVIVFVATIGTLFSIPGQTMGFSVFTEVLMAELGLSRVTLSLAYCIGTVASGLTLPWLGQVLDRLGERKMSVASAVVTGLVLFYFAGAASMSFHVASLLPPSFRAAVAFVVISIGFYLIRAAAQGVLIMSCRNAIGKWFNHRRGIALAISGVVTSLGFSLAPRGLDFLIERFSYTGAWMVLGIATLGVMAPLAWLLVRDAPEESGLVMDGGVVAQPERENLDMRIHREFTRDEAVLTYSFWLFNLTFSFYGLYATAFTFHIVSLADEIGFTKDRILTLFVPMAAMSVVTSLLFGAINARVRLKYLLFVMNLGCVLAAIGLLKLNTPLGIPAYIVGNGIAGGGFVSLSGIVFPRFYGRLHLGAISGVNMSCMVIASGLGPLLFGWCAQATGSYELVLVASIIVPAVFTLMSLKADNPQRGVVP